MTPSLQNSQPWRFRRHPDGIGFPTARRLAAEVIDP